jgi:hypothetical protein
MTSNEHFKDHESSAATASRLICATVRQELAGLGMAVDDVRALPQRDGMDDLRAITFVIESSTYTPCQLTHHGDVPLMTAGACVDALIERFVYLNGGRRAAVPTQRAVAPGEVVDADTITQAMDNATTQALLLPRHDPARAALLLIVGILRVLTRQAEARRIAPLETDEDASND